VNNTIRQLLDQINALENELRTALHEQESRLPIRSMASALSSNGRSGMRIPGSRSALCGGLLPIDPKTCFARRLSTA